MNEGGREGGKEGGRGRDMIEVGGQRRRRVYKRGKNVESSRGI